MDEDQRAELMQTDGQGDHKMDRTDDAWVADVEIDSNIVQLDGHAVGEVMRWLDGQLKGWMEG